MGLRHKLGTLVARAADVSGRVERATAQNTVAVATHPSTKWVAKTGGKAIFVGAGTAVGLAIGGPVGAAICATITGTMGADRGTVAPPPSAQA